MLNMYPGILFFAVGNCLNFMSFAYAAQVGYASKENSVLNMQNEIIIYMGKVMSNCVSICQEYSS
jgi:hypothetical protein